MTAVFGDLARVVGRLEVVLTGARPVRTVPERTLAEALGRWLVLCRRAGMASASALVWRKFPAVCPYCERAPHDAAVCQGAPGSLRPPDWLRLATRARSLRARRPRSIADWTAMFHRIYPKDARTSHDENVRRLGQEMSELAWAIERLAVSDVWFRNEAADVFAWLMGIANQLHHERAAGAAGDESEGGRSLERALAQLYEGRSVGGRRRGARRPRRPLAGAASARAGSAPDGEVAVELAVLARARREGVPARGRGAAHASPGAPRADATSARGRRQRASARTGSARP